MSQTNMKDLEQIEMSIEQAKAYIEQRNALFRLEHNADFKKLFMDNYLRDNAVRLVKLKASPQFNKPEQQAEVIKQLDAIGNLDQFIRMIVLRGNQSEAALINDEAERAKIIQED